MVLSTAPTGTTQPLLNTYWEANSTLHAQNIGPAGDITLRGSADLGLVANFDVTTDLVWYVVIANWLDTDLNTRSYKLFTLTFSAP
jgi:hypothetical protein